MGVPGCAGLSGESLPGSLWARSAPQRQLAALPRYLPGRHAGAAPSSRFPAPDPTDWFTGTSRLSRSLPSSQNI